MSAERVADLLDVLVAPGALADLRTARGVVDDAAAAHGARVRFAAPADEDALGDALAAVGGEVVLLAGDDRDVDVLGVPAGTSVLRVDLHDRDVDPSAAVRRHLRGRGLDGLRWAVDAWAHHAASPGRRVAYGPHRDQHATLRLPDGPAPATGHPVAVLVHGGYWRTRWEDDTTEAAALDLTARGWASWNVEYRRPAEAGFDATTADVAAALDALADVAEGGVPLDTARVTVLGHSAGGQLVVRLAADLAGPPTGPAGRVRPALTVSLAGVLDLVVADRRWLGEGAVSAALGARAADAPAAYAAASPAARLPVGAPVAVVCGTGDGTDLLDASRAWAAAATDAGDDVVAREGPGDHFAVVDPRSALWREQVVPLLR